MRDIDKFNENRKAIEQKLSQVISILKELDNIDEGYGWHRLIYQLDKQVGIAQRGILLDSETVTSI